MESSDDHLLRSHLADFETTLSHLLRAQEAVALLNFAALFHKTIYLTDTAIGDHRLIIDSFRQGHSGLFSRIGRLAEEKILRLLCRDKVVVRGKQLGNTSQPSITEIFEGWKYRDQNEWGGEVGFTAAVDKDLRMPYLREVDDLMSRHDIREPYNPDVPKQAFREAVLGLLDREPPSQLSQAIARLAPEIRTKYLKATQDPWFTNAELWRVLRHVEDAQEAIILHAHVNQQCYADLTGSGQATHDRHTDSLASFNFELQRRRPLALEIEAPIVPPNNLAELLERAPVVLKSPGIEMFERLSVEDVLTIRKRAHSLFGLATRRVETMEELETLRGEYVKELERYWNFILASLETKFPEKMLRRRVWLFSEHQLPPLGSVYQNFGKDVFALVVRFTLPALSPFVSPLLNGATRLGFNFLHERTPEAERLGAQLPPTEWKRKSPRGLLGL